MKNPLTPEQLNALQQIQSICEAHDDECTDCPFAIYVSFNLNHPSDAKPSLCAMSDIPLFWQLNRYQDYPPISKNDQLFLLGLQYGGIDIIEIHDTYRNWVIPEKSISGIFPNYILEDFPTGTYKISELLKENK